MTAIAVPLGAILAFLIVRTDVPGRNWLEVVILVPIFVSAVVLAFGYVVALGPVGIVSLAVKDLIGLVPWNLYSFSALVVIAGLGHVPHVYLYAALISVWLACTVVWLAYGMRLISGTLLQVGPELEEAGRSMGASETRVKFDVTLPLIRYGMLASWLLVFLIFVREYSTGIYLLGPGTEVIGSLLVSLWGTGAIDLVSALSVVNVAMIALGLLIAIRLGVRLHG